MSLEHAMPGAIAVSVWPIVPIRHLRGVIDTMREDAWVARTGVAAGTESLRAGDEGWTERIEGLVRSIAASAMNTFTETATRGKTVLSRMRAGSVIRGHVDTLEPSWQSTVRVHFPLYTNPGACLVFLPDAHTTQYHPFHLTEGRMWRIKHGRPHCAFNAGEATRIHLIMDFIFEARKVGEE